MSLTKVQKEGIETLINNNADNRVITGSGTANTLNGESNVVIDSSSRVGIGTTSPQQPLHLHTSSSSAANMVFSNTTTGSGASDGFVVGLDGAERGQIFNQENTDLLFGTNNLERMRIDSSGKVGIGTTSPNRVFEINNSQPCIRLTNGTNGFDIGTGGFVDGSNSLIFFDEGVGERMRIDSSGNVGIGSTSGLGKLHVKNSASGATSVSGNANEFVIENSGNCGMTIQSSVNGVGNIYFGDVANGSVGRITYDHSNDNFNFNTAGNERVRLDNNGNFMVGTGSPSSSTAASGISLNADGAMISRRDGVMHYYKSISTGGYYAVQFLSANTSVGNIFFNSGGTQFNTSSDYRRKENIVSLTNGLSKLKQLKTYNFNFKDNPSETVQGFLAHEAQEVIPHVVTGTKDQVATAKEVEEGVAQNIGDPIYQTIDHSKLVPLLTAALQEAVAKIEVLETKVAALEAA